MPDLVKDGGTPIPASIFNIYQYIFLTEVDEENLTSHTL